jgi:hypothetical protein
MQHCRVSIIKAQRKVRATVLQITRKSLRKRKYLLGFLQLFLLKMKPTDLKPIKRDGNKSKTVWFLFWS